MTMQYNVDNLPAAKPLRGIEKVAALLLAMNKEAAARCLSHFEPEEIRLITRAAAQLGAVKSEQLDALAEEFLSQFAAGHSLYGSAGEVQKLLDGLLPEDQIAEIMADVLGNSNRSIWDRVATMSENVLANYLAKEHPQTAALILSKIRPATVARIMSQMPPNKRNRMMRRMLNIKPVVQEVMREVEKTLHEDFMLNFSGTLEADTYARMADVLNKMEREHMEETLEDLRQDQPKAAEILKGLLFTFDDILNLSPRARMAIFDQINTDQIVTALKGTDASFREGILSALTSRARRIVEHELAAGSPTPQREVLQARRMIADLALDMAGRGDIDISTKSEQDTYFN